MVLRVVVPPVAGAATSLGLLYLYHQATLANHADVQAQLLRSTRALHAVEAQSQAHSDTDAATTTTPAAATQPAPRSAFQRQRYTSLPEQIQASWNSNLVYVTQHLSSLELDNVVASAVALVTKQTSSIIDSVKANTSDATPTPNNNNNTPRTATLSLRPATSTMADDQAPAALLDEKTFEDKKQATSALKSFLSGGFGGVSAVLVGHPFDLTKTRLQTAAEGTYTGGMDVVRKTLKADGVKGMYRGMGPPLVGVTPIFALSFWSYDMGKKIVYSLTPDRKDPKLGYGELAFAGFFSAVPTTLVAGPAERVKVLLQLQGQSGATGPTYNGPIDVVRQLYKEGGLRSIFRGTGATLARDGPGSAAYFVSYESVKRLLTPAGQDPNDLNLLNVLLAGGSAGMAMWAIAIPPDVVKSRLQGAPQGTYSGFLDCARKLVAKDGVSALFKGFGPAMARAFPANAATFLGVEVSLSLMNKTFPSL